MAKQQNTYAKRQREMEKKQKADDKRKRRKEREELKGQPGYTGNTQIVYPDREDP